MAFNLLIAIPPLARSTVRPKRRIIIYDPRQMFLLAEEFRRAKTLLTQTQRRAGLLSREWVPKPTIMISAVSLELYLKCLYILDHSISHKKLHTHDIKTLFDLLPPETKRKLREYFDPAEGQRILDFHRQHHGRDVPGMPCKFTFDFALFGSSNTFEWIRYAYERPNRPSEQWFGSPLIDAARKLIVERNPGWAAMNSVGPEPPKYIVSTYPNDSIRRLRDK
jgi:hypothetical protein